MRPRRETYVTFLHFNLHNFTGTVASTGGAVAYVLSPKTRKLGFTQLTTAAEFTAETVFYSNFARYDGGALYVYNGKVFLGGDTLFYDNTATSGRALLVVGALAVEFAGETGFMSNNAFSGGGAVGSTPLDQSEYSYSSVTAPTAEESVLVFKYTTQFIDNAAGANGGGIWHS